MADLQGAGHSRTRARLVISKASAARRRATEASSHPQKDANQQDTKLLRQKPARGAASATPHPQGDAEKAGFRAENETSGSGTSPRGLLFSLLLWTAFAGFVFTYVSLYGVRYLGSSFTDFPSYWLGAQVAFRFHEVPYGETFLQHAASLEQHVHPFVYPPPSLPLFYPFAFMDLETASTAMLAINVVTALGLGFLLARPTVDFAPLPVVLLLNALVAS